MGLNMFGVSAAVASSRFPCTTHARNLRPCAKRSTHARGESHHHHAPPPPLLSWRPAPHDRGCDSIAVVQQHNSRRPSPPLLLRSLPSGPPRPLGPSSEEDERSLPKRLEQALSTNPDIDRPPLRRAWTFVVAPTLTLLCSLGSLLSVSPAAAAAVPDPLGLVFVAARLATLLHVAAALSCAAAARSRGASVLWSFARGYASGFVALLDLLELPETVNE